MTSAASVGMIGLGLMGSALAARLLEAGVAVSGFDIDPARGEALRAMGGAAASSVTQLTAQNRSIVIAVSSGGQVQSVFNEFAQNEHPARPLVICTTTCAPGEIADIAERARRAGLPLVEAPISGTSAEVRQGSATVLVAGEAGAIEAANAILDILCPQRIHVGMIGDASRTKLAINLILQNNRASLAEGIVLPRVSDWTLRLSSPPRGELLLIRR
jgi:L-threonate 2-dehydrogenase